MKIPDIPVLLFGLYNRPVAYHTSYKVYNGTRFITVGALNCDLLPTDSYLLLLTHAPRSDKAHNKPHAHLYLVCRPFSEKDLNLNETEVLRNYTCLISYDATPHSNIWEVGKGYWLQENIGLHTAEFFNTLDTVDRGIMLFVQDFQANLCTFLDQVEERNVQGFWEREIRPGPFEEKPTHYSW